MEQKSIPAIRCMFRVVFFVMLWLTESSLRASFVEAFFPRNIKLGLSAEQLNAMRPAVTKSPAALLPRSSQETSKLYEMIERVAPATFYTYVFRDNALQAVIRSEPVISNLPPAMNPQELNSLLSQSFQFVRSDAVARASGSLKHSAITAELWNDSQTKLQVYFVSTSEETTLILFNPSILNGGNFFVGADKIPQLQGGADLIRSQTKTDLKSAPPLIDRPWKTKSASSPFPTSNVSAPKLLQTNTNEKGQVDFSPQRSCALFKEKYQVRAPANLFVIVGALLAAGISVLFFIFNRR